MNISFDTSQLPEGCHPRYGLPRRNSFPASYGNSTGSVFTPYLNTYVLSHTPSSSFHDKQGAGELLLGDKGYVREHLHSFSDFLRLLTYEFGFVNISDLTYYLGMNKDVLGNQLRRLTADGTLIRYQGPVSFGSEHYYLFGPAATPFKELRKSGHPSIWSFAYKGNVPQRSIAHSYGTGLSLLLIRLYCLYRQELTISFDTERSVGNFAISLNSRQGAEVAIDALISIQDADGHKKHICLEFDTGKEYYTALLQKFRDYGYTQLYRAETAHAVSILFSYSPTGMEPDTSLTLAKRERFCALYALIYIHLKVIRYCPDTYLSENILPDCSDRASFRAMQQGMDSVPAAYLKGLCRELCEKDADSPIYGCSTDNIIEAVMNPWGGLYEVFSQFAKICGIQDHKGRILTDSIPFRFYHDFLISFSPDTGILVRWDYNARIYAKCTRRRNRLISAILDEMDGITRRIDKEQDKVFLQSEIPLPDNTVHFTAMLGGYGCHMYPMQLITNQMTFILWDRSSMQIQFLEESLRECFRLLDYGVLGETREGSVFRNCYQIEKSGQMPHTEGSFQVFVEDISSDIGASIRLLRGFTGFIGTGSDLLVLLADTVWDAWDFLYANRNRPAVKQILNVLPSSVNDSDSISLAAWMGLPCCHIAFMEKAMHPFADGRLFIFDENGKRIYLSAY